MDIVSLREQWKPFFDKIRQTKEFEEFTKDPWSQSFYNLCAAINKVFPDFVFDSDSGETKFVIIPENYDVVFKFPNIPAKHGSSIDYCLVEARNYRAAVEKHLDKYFAWCDKLFDVYTPNGYYPIYVMEKVNCDEQSINEELMNWFDSNYDEPDSKDEKEMIEYEDTLQEFSDGSSVAVDLWFESIFPDDYMRLIQFFATNFIDDIHSGNLGYRNGEIVITDYCGYRALFDSKLPKDWYSKYGF